MLLYKVRSVLFGAAACLYLLGALGALGVFGGLFGSRVPGLFGAMFLALGFAFGIPAQSPEDRERRKRIGTIDPFTDL